MLFVLFLLCLVADATDVVLQVQHWSTSLPLKTQGIVWEEEDAAEASACPDGTFAPAGATHCTACTFNCGLEEYRWQQCTLGADAQCAMCRGVCVAPKEYQYMDCSLLQNRVCFPAQYMNLSGVVSFYCTSDTRQMSLHLEQILCAEVGPEAVCSVQINNTDFFTYSADISISFVYNDSYGTMLHSDLAWKPWWTVHLQQAAAYNQHTRRFSIPRVLRSSGRRDGNDVIDVLAIRETASNISQCPDKFDAQEQLQCVAQPCPLGFGGAHGDCVPCVPGTFKANVSDTACEACPAHTYATHYNATTCLVCERTTTLGGIDCVCELGTYGPTCASVCEPGFYASSYGACTSCPAGTFSSGNASTTCVRCTDGFFSSSNGSHQCEACLPGSYGTANTCVLCGIGFYGDEYAATSCFACSAGFYSNTTGMSSCLACMPGSYGNATAASMCAVCDVGFYGDAYAATSCLACSYGFYSNTTGISSCLACMPGSYSNATSASMCAVCDVGFYSTAAGTSCYIPTSTTTTPSTTSTTTSSTTSTTPSTTTPSTTSTTTTSTTSTTPSTTSTTTPSTSTTPSSTTAWSTLTTHSTTTASSSSTTTASTITTAITMTTVSTITTTTTPSTTTIFITAAAAAVQDTTSATTTPVLLIGLVAAGGVLFVCLLICIGLCMAQRPCCYITHDHTDSDNASRET